MLRALLPPTPAAHAVHAHIVSSLLAVSTPLAVPHAWGAVRSRVRRVLSWQAPPRRFWTWWCGGMDVQDILVLAFVLALNIYYFVFYMKRYISSVNASECRSWARRPSSAASNWLAVSSSRSPVRACMPFHMVPLG